MLVESGVVEFVIPPLERQKQADDVCEFEVNLISGASSKPARTTQ